MNWLRGQNEVAQAKLKLELFGKRHDVYMKSVTFLHDVTEYGVDKLDFQPFRLAIADASFLFGEEVAQYLTELNSQAEKMKELVDQLDNKTSRERALEMADECNGIEEHLSREIRFVHTHFSKYLSFEKWQ